MNRRESSSIFISPGFMDMGEKGLGLSTGVMNYSEPEKVQPVLPPVFKIQKKEAFFIQNQGLDALFPLNMIKFDHSQKFNSSFDLNKLFEFVNLLDKNGLRGLQFENKNFPGKRDPRKGKEKNSDGGSRSTGQRG